MQDPHTFHEAKSAHLHEAKSAHWHDMGALWITTIKLCNGLQPLIQQHNHHQK
jgi:hypothetical protein